MIVRTSPRFATIGSRLRNAVLVVFALFVAHDAIYVAQYGVGTDLARAMTVGGHDGYWAPVSLVIAGAGALAFLITIGLLGRLERRASQSADGAISAGPSYFRELASAWIRLFPLVALLLGLQENLERFVADGHLAGLWALFGPDASAVMPVLALTTLVSWLPLGSLIRWRVRVPGDADRGGEPTVVPASGGRQCGPAPADRLHRQPLDPRPTRRGPGAAGSPRRLTTRATTTRSRVSARPSAGHREDTRMLRARTHVRRLIAVAVAALLTMLSAGAVTAHEERNVAGYSFEVGFIDEPVFVGDKSGLRLLRPQGRHSRRRCTKSTVKAEVIYQGQKRDLPIEAREDDPGAYQSEFIPTAAGAYTFHLTGTVEGQAIDESFTSSPTGFNKVQALSSGQFPVVFPAQADVIADARRAGPQPPGHHRDRPWCGWIADGTDRHRPCARSAAPERLKPMTRSRAALVAVWSIALAGLMFIGPATPLSATRSWSPANRPQAMSSRSPRPRSGWSSPNPSRLPIRSWTFSTRPARPSPTASAHPTRQIRTRSSRRCRSRPTGLHRQLASAVGDRWPHDLGLLHVRRRQRRAAPGDGLDRRRRVDPRRPRSGRHPPRDQSGSSGTSACSWRSVWSSAAGSSCGIRAGPGWPRRSPPSSVWHPSARRGSSFLGRAAPGSTQRRTSRTAGAASCSSAGC